MPSATNALATNRACGVPGRVVGMSVGNAAKIFKRTQIVATNAITVGVHAAEFPLRDRMTIGGRIFQRGDAAAGIAGLQAPACRSGMHRLETACATGRANDCPKSRGSRRAERLPLPRARRLSPGGASGAEVIEPRETDRPQPPEPRRRICLAVKRLRRADQARRQQRRRKIRRSDIRITRFFRRPARMGHRAIARIADLLGVFPNVTGCELRFARLPARCALLEFRL